MYRIYWIVWGLLLAITVAMVALDQAPLPRPLFVALMLAAMTAKAALIAAYFMHLRFERLSLTLGVFVGLILNATILWVLIAPDATRILQMNH